MELNMINVTTYEDLQKYSEGNELPLLPPPLDIETKNIMRKAISANRALAELKNKADLLPNQDILISNIALTEAKDSSEIENIFTTSDVLYKADITPENQLDPGTKEVKSYNRALWLGIKLIKEKPLNTNSFISIVQAIKQNTAGIRKSYGTIIKNGNTGEIVHIPPQGENLIREKLKNLEDFLYENNEIDPLIKMAVLHYQFEAIHPFADGNGRTGRIINILWLVQNELLNRPILFLSAYFLKHRQEYYEYLKNVTDNKDWENWIIYILNAVEETSKQTKSLIEKIITARKEFKNELQTYFPKIYSGDLVEAIFSSPYFRLADVLKIYPTISYPTAARHLTALTLPYTRKDGTTGQLLTVSKIGRENIYINNILLEILTTGF